MYTSKVRAALLKDSYLIPMGVFLTMENIVAIFILYRCSRLNFQIKILSINMAVTDLLTGVMLSTPLEVLLVGNERCELKKYVSFLFINTSIFTITTFNLDRCFVFWLAMRYYSYITKKLVVKSCVFLWITSFIVTYFMFYDEDHSYGICCGYMYTLKKNIINNAVKSFLLLLVFSNLIMYGYLLRCIKGSLRRTFDLSHFRTCKMINNQSNVVKKLSVITGLFLAMYTPFILTLTFPILDYSKTSGKLIHTLTGVLMVLNSAVNPILYIWRFKEPRYQLKRLLCFFHKNYLEKMQHAYTSEVATYNISTEKDVYTFSYEKGQDSVRQGYCTSNELKVDM
ncbi:sphingosine 1-phosphate receptor 1-like [Saccostrea cucullata]|uniref:sphingosine 1-phosphate receptor 1-like n=1 Tax=Saccostrea cuccullata TaxID=36930 RepID=UPI002ECFC72E